MTATITVTKVDKKIKEFISEPFAWLKTKLLLMGKLHYLLLKNNQ